MGTLCLLIARFAGRNIINRGELMKKVYVEISLLFDNIRLSCLPNYLFTKTGVQLDVADLTDSALRKYGKAWTKELIEHAKRRRANKK